MKLSIVLLVILQLIRISQGDWFCGGVWIGTVNESQCKCGSEVFARSRGNDSKIQCCGPDTCSFDEHGNGICLDGITCSTSDDYKPYNCGDVMIAKENTCWCGNFSIDYDEYSNNETWCCPSEPCYYSQDNGTAVCQNATVVQGRKNGCDSEVCYNRDYLSCKSGNQCVYKENICHGKPLCDDASDLAMCDFENKDICIPNYFHSKCPEADIPTDHQECYVHGRDANNQKYDCLTRGDESNEETSFEVTIDYDSITACNITNEDGSIRFNGLMCGSECMYIMNWCNPEWPTLSCITNTTAFTAHNPILCQNRTFWEDIDCDWYGGGKLLSGYRCKGWSQHCYYPELYSKYPDLNQCADFSDKIILAKENCSEEFDEEDQCQCYKTEDGKKSYFQCPINNTAHCIHPELVCDGHAACDNSEDEKLTHGCIAKLTKFKTLKPEATKVCISKMYADKNMMKVAVACDGVEECFNGEDEGWLCTNYTIPFYGTMFICVIILLFLIAYKLFKGDFVDTMENSELLNLPNILNEDIFERNQSKVKFRDDINLFIQLSKLLDSKSDRIAKNKKLYDLESKIHRENIAEIRLCLKNTLNWSNAKIVIEDAFPGFLRKNLEFIENILERLDQKNLPYWIFNKVKTVFNIYLDICKDTIFTVTILLIIGGPTSLYYFPTKLTSVVVYCFMVTIIVPLVCSSILHTQRELKHQKEVSFCKKMLKIFQSFLFSPLIPLVLAESYEENKAKRKSLIKFEKNRDLVLELNKEGRKLSKNYSEFVRVDLGQEVVFQLSGQIMYLLLSSTNTPTTGGLEVMFQKTSDAFLALSIGLSVKTIYFVKLKTISIVKPFLPFTTKMILLSWIMVSASLRVMAIVLFFTPSFGIFSILGHWKLEQIPYSDKVNERIQANNNTIYLCNTKPFNWKKLDRYNYTSFSGPDYTVYTQYALHEYFFSFWILLFLHTFINLLVKIAFSEDFRRYWTSSTLEMFIHCFENTNIPTVWMDWEEMDGSIEDHKKRHGQVVKEMVVIMIIRTLIHAVMLAPIVFTATKVWERHELLSSTIGVMNIEQVSYENVTILFYTVIVLFPLLCILEICLYCLYQFKFHPWVEIILKCEDQKEDTTNASLEKLSDEENEDAQKAWSRNSSHFRKGINEILELASNVLTETGITIQDKIDIIEKSMGDLEERKEYSAKSV